MSIKSNIKTDDSIPSVGNSDNTIAHNPSFVNSISALMFEEKSNERRQQFIALLEQIIRNPASDRNGRWKQLGDICEQLALGYGPREAGFDDITIDLYFASYVKLVLSMFVYVDSLRAIKSKENE